MDSVARLYTTWPEFHWWNLSCIGVVCFKPNALLSAYSDSTMFSVTSVGLHTCIMHSQNDSSSSWLQYITIFTMPLWHSLASDSTDYPGCDSRWWRDFLHQSRMAPRSTHPPVQWKLGLLPGSKVDRTWCWSPTPSRALVVYGWKHTCPSSVSARHVMGQPLPLCVFTTTTINFVKTVVTSLRFFYLSCFIY
jgi:hypothetical protein